jgi:hypothetical protein
VWVSDVEHVPSLEVRVAVGTIEGHARSLDDVPFLDEVNY